MRYIVTNDKHTKGILLDANNMDDAKKKANDFFYSPFPRKNDLNTIQAYEKNKHLFVSVNGNKQFGYVQFNTMGGVSTSYDATIDTEPTQAQLDFLNKPIEYIKFFSTAKDRY